MNIIEKCQSLGLSSKATTFVKTLWDAAEAKGQASIPLKIGLTTNEVVFNFGVAMGLEPGDACSFSWDPRDYPEVEAPMRELFTFSMFNPDDWSPQLIETFLLSPEQVFGDDEWGDPPIPESDYPPHFRD